MGPTLIKTIKHGSKPTIMTSMFVHDLLYEAAMKHGSPCAGSGFTRCLKAPRDLAFSFGLVIVTGKRFRPQASRRNILFRQLLGTSEALGIDEVHKNLSISQDKHTSRAFSDPNNFLEHLKIEQFLGHS